MRTERIPPLCSLMFPLFSFFPLPVITRWCSGYPLLKHLRHACWSNDCRACQIWNKQQHLKRRRVEFRWASQNPAQGFFHADEDGGAEGWNLIFYSWGFMAFCLSCQSCVCVCVRVCVCVCVRASYKQSTWGHHTHIALSQQHITPHWEGRNKSMPVCRRCQCVWLHTHTHTYIHEHIQ